MESNTQRRFSEAEEEWMRLNASKFTKSQTARKLGARVTAVDNWARRNGIQFLGFRKKVRAAVIPKKPAFKETQDVDRLMSLVAKVRA